MAITCAGQIPRPNWYYIFPPRSKAQNPAPVVPTPTHHFPEHRSLLAIRTAFFDGDEAMIHADPGAVERRHAEQKGARG